MNNLKTRIRVLYDAAVSLFCRIGYDKLWHVIAGLVIASFFCVTLRMEACIVPVVFAALVKEFFDLWTVDNWNWKDFIATLAGGAVIQLFQIIAL